MPSLINIVLILLLILVNGFFVAAEFGMVKIRASRVTELANAGNRHAKTAQKVLAHLDAYLSATQLGITLASLALGWIGEPTIAGLLNVPLHKVGLGDVVETISFVIAFLVVTFLHIVLGELTPKSLAIHRTEGTVLNAATPLMWFHKLMYPFIWLLNGAANGLLRTIGINPAKQGEQAHTEEEIRILMNQSHRSGFIDNTEMALFDNIFEFSDRIARQVMVPRIDMIAIPLDATEQEVREVVAKYQHTRYPVEQGDKDDIVGYVHVKDLMVNQQLGTGGVAEALRTVIKVPETAEISDVLRRMQKDRTQIVIVADEFGGTAGLVTMEDIIEELVGEIQDEFDDELPPILCTKAGYSIDGRVLLEEVNDLLGVQLDEVGVNTIGGWMLSVLPGSPRLGEVLERRGFEFKVEKTNNRRIERVFVHKVHAGVTSTE